MFPSSCIACFLKMYFFYLDRILRMLISLASILLLSISLRLITNWCSNFKHCMLVLLYLLRLERLQPRIQEGRTTCCYLSVLPPRRIHAENLQRSSWLNGLLLSGNDLRATDHVFNTTKPTFPSKKNKIG